MSREIVCAALLAGLLLSCGGPTKEEQQAQKETQKFQEMLNKYLDQYFKDHPQQATEAGLHEFDGYMPAFTREHLVGHIDRLKKALNELAGLDTKRLPRELLYDHQILESKIRAEILDLTEIRGWMRNPNVYNELVSNSIASLTDFHFASPEARLKSVISRLDQVPEITAAMQKNMENPSSLYVDIAREQFASTATFLRQGLLKAFVDVGDKNLQDKLKASSERAGKAYDEAIKFLANDLSRRARGGYSLGSKFFQQKLFYDEMVDTSIENLVKMGEEELSRTQSEMQKVAKSIDPGKSVAQILDGLGADHPKAEQLVSEASSLTEGLRRFVSEKNLVTIPPDEVPKVRALEPFTQGLLLARLDSPGPLESAIASFYTITLPDPSWSASRKEQHLRLLNRSVLPIVSIHETYPGHYLQFLHGRQASSKIRKVLGSDAFREGWASYAEQMMLDEGYGNKDPKLRLAQLQFALLRAARFMAAIRIHGQGTMGEKEGVSFFMKEAYLSTENAQRETNRVALDPSVSSYTLGKLEILRLREDYKKAKGAEFTLKDFHDSLLKHGYPPLKIVREILLPASKTPS